MTVTITAQGISIFTQQEIKTYYDEQYRIINPEWPIDSSDIDGQWIQVNSIVAYNYESAILNAYNASDPAKASRESLIGIGQISGVTPKAATSSTATLSFSGTNGVNIFSGFQVTDINGNIWATDAATTVGTDVTATCQTEGRIEANAGTITTLTSVVEGVTGVTNNAIASAGQDEENTEAFRIRRDKTTALPSQNQLDSVYSAVNNVEGVIKAEVYENRLSTTSNNLNPNSFAVYAIGGLDQDVAKALAAVVPVGVNQNQDATPGGTLVDEDTTTPAGRPTKVAFFRPQEVPIYVVVDVDNGPDLTEDDKDTIKQAIVDFSTGTYLDSSIPGFDKTGLAIGEDVKVGPLYTPVNSVLAGRGTAEIKIGSAPSPSGTSVAIQFFQDSEFAIANIVVNYAN